ARVGRRVAPSDRSFAASSTAPPRERIERGPSPVATAWNRANRGSVFQHLLEQRPAKHASVPSATRVVLLRSLDMGDRRISYLTGVCDWTVDCSVGCATCPEHLT